MGLQDISSVNVIDVLSATVPVNIVKFDVVSADNVYRDFMIANSKFPNTEIFLIFSNDIFLFFSAEYEVGAPVANTPCSFLVNGAAKQTGVILSPTYPGAYPKALTCSYKFLGTLGQRVRLEFRDFDLFFGGPQ